MPEVATLRTKPTLTDPTFRGLIGSETSYMCKPSTVFPTQSVVAFVLPAPPFVSALVEGADSLDKCALELLSKKVGDVAFTSDKSQVRRLSN